MDKTGELLLPIKPKQISEKVKYWIISSYALFFLLCAFGLNTPYEILLGLKRIMVSPSILITDYIVVGNMGAAFFNSGILMLFSILISYHYKTHLNGTLIAAIFTVGGFAFFGKNIYNILSIILGVYIYSSIQKEKFNKYILIALFGTSLGPLVSQISFGFGMPTIIGIILGNASGIIVGIVLPALAGHFVIFHQGFSLYNIGFSSGIIGTFFMSMLRAFGKDNPGPLLVSEGNNILFSTILGLLFISLIIIGYICNNKSFKNYVRLFRHSGRLIEDFVLMDGFGITLINMGFVGIIAICYVLIVNGELSGPTIGGILTIVGFGGFGKHPKNIIPILIGVFLGAWLQVWDVDSASALLAALFGTTLAPIAGRFGWKAGILAGFLHITIVMNIGYLHGGMNLYNNGFSGGFIAGTLVPIFESFGKEEK